MQPKSRRLALPVGILPRFGLKYILVAAFSSTSTGKHANYQHHCVCVGGGGVNGCTCGGSGCSYEWKVGVESTSGR